MCFATNGIRGRLLKLAWLIPLQLVGASVPLAADDGDLDLAFHPAEDGIFQAGGPGDAQAAQLIPAPDGATVVLYHYAEPDGTERQDRWRWVTESGAGAFCPLTAPSVTGIVARSATFDLQGRLVVVGTDYDDTRQVVVERFLYPGCTRDPAFDGNGLAGYLAGELAIGVDLAAQRIGSLAQFEDYYYLVATVQDPETQVVLMRLREDGSPDTGWGGGDGRVQAGLAGARVFARDMERDAHGRFTVAVLIEVLSPHDFDFGVFRFTSGGGLDASFDGDGRKAIPFDLVPNGVDTPNAIALSHDGRIAVIGTVTGADADELGIAVLREDGSYESAFDGDGRLHHPIGYLATGDAGAFQSDGRLLAGGEQIAPLGASSFVPAHFAPYVARFGPDGDFDAGFGDGGIATPGATTFAGVDARSTCAALDGGRPMVGGSVRREADQLDNLFLLRLESRLIFADGFESRNSYWW